MTAETFADLLSATRGRRDADWQGRSLLVINESWGELIVSRQGAHLLHYAPAGERGWLWTTPTPKAVPGAIRGGVPLCWPWFAEPEDGQGPMHGLARTADWRIDAIDEEIEGGVEIHLSPEKPLHDQLAPRLVIRANARRLELELITEHRGETPLKLTQALHAYFAVADVHRARVEGLAGARYLDKLDDFAERDQNGELGVRGALDRIYHSSRPLLLDDGQRRLRIAKQGSDSSVVWHPGDSAPGDVPDEQRYAFLCIEPACTRLDPVWLAPGAQHLLALHISAEPAEPTAP
ncbi:D-hexose-6-phosphate mutarotase [Kushneria aurantia]|uniref:Putative glucose-6-phosphate 1-epimerase n=1 Tax=Kushneria aurantia TaxID=504092 RepID=A0ABV6FZ50_9GAMM|nr:D-hexose-6-phosphate mutarotase [Kushneria aurantia]